MQIDNKILKEIRTHEALKEVEIIEGRPDGLRLNFKEGAQRTGAELLAVQDILFKNNVFNFIKSEKVSFWDNEIKTISITIY